MIHRLLIPNRHWSWQDEPPGIDLRKVPARARSRVKKAEQVLRRFGFWPKRRVEHVEIKTFDGRSLVEGIVKAARGIDLIYNGECRRVLVGPDVMEQLRCEMHERQGPFSFHERVPLSGPNGMRVFGMEVCYIPWMRGVLLVPELEPSVAERGW